MERLEAHPPPIGSSGQDLQGGGLLPMPRPLDLGGSTQGGGWCSLPLSTATNIERAQSTPHLLHSLNAAARTRPLHGFALTPCTLPSTATQPSPPCASLPCTVAPVPAGPHPDAPTGPPQLLEAIQVQAATERLASKLGPSHPQIPRAWLAVARLFQALGPAGGPEAVSRAAAALNHVRETCHAMAQAAGSTVQPACDSALSYLLERTGQQGGLGTA